MVEEKKSSPATARRFNRLKQLKKILPSDRISIEKHFPRLWDSWRFHDKKQQPGGSRRASSVVQDLRCDQSSGSSAVVDRLADGIGHVCSFRKTPGADLDDDGDDAREIRRPPIDINMADHLTSVTMQRGCWLQATAAKDADRPAGPQILFTHRKDNSSKTRAQLAVEVMQEFERQKTAILLLQRHSSDCCCRETAFTRSSYQKSLPIFNRASINLHTRRVS